MEGVPTERYFYMHTSLDAEDAISQQIGQPINLESVDPYMQSQVLNLLYKPEYTGCGHLGLVLRYPDLYDIPLYLTQGLIQCFYNYLWNLNDNAKAKLHHMDLVILGGVHTEIAVIRVKTTRLHKYDPECSVLHPLVRPTDLDGTQTKHIFVDSPEAVDILRTYNAQFFYSQLNSTGLDNFLTWQLLKAEIDNLADKQLRMTLSRLANGLPVYWAKILVGDPGEKIETMSTPYGGSNTNIIILVVILLVIGLIVVVVGGVIWRYTIVRRNRVIEPLNV